MGANSSSPEGLANNPAHPARRREATPFRLLTVKVIKAKNIEKADTFTESDCYVTLSLPTASSDNVRTATVHNTKNPVWNQSFCYRIDSRIKNVLQLKICDEDTFTRDDELYTVLFDVAKLHPGKTSRVVFKLNPKTWEELEIEFSLQYMAHRNGYRAAPAATNTNTNTSFLTSASRWASWFRNIHIPRPPGF